MDLVDLVSHGEGSDSWPGASTFGFFVGSRGSSRLYPTAELRLGRAFRVLRGSCLCGPRTACAFGLSACSRDPLSLLRFSRALDALGRPREYTKERCFVERREQPTRGVYRGRRSARLPKEKF